MSSIVDFLKAWDIPQIRNEVQIKCNLYEITCVPREKYILKPRHNFNSFEDEYNLLNYLKYNGIPVPVPIKAKDGALYKSKDGLNYCLFDYFEGDILVFNYYINNTEALYLQGKALGKLHNKMNTYTGKIDTYPVMDLEKYVFDFSIPQINRAYPTNEIGKIINEIGTQLKDIYKKLPKQLIHSDAHCGNILFNDNILSGFIDFDLCQVGSIIFDLCFLILYPIAHIIYNEEDYKRWAGLISIIILGYESENPLNKFEKESIWYLLLSLEIHHVAAYAYVQPDDAQRTLKLINWIYANKELITSKYIM